jgi:hypothetical protein
MKGESFVLSEQLAASLLYEYWSCLPGFSSLVPEGRAGLIRILQQVSVSVDHARYIASRFDQRCPTPREIREHADRVREEYQPKPNRVDEWKKGADPDPGFSAKLLAKMGKPDQYDELRWQGIRDALEREASPMPFCRGGAPNCKCSTCKEARNSRGFWAEFLFQMRRDHPDEVAAIREGREPQLPERRPVMQISSNRPPMPSTVITKEDIAAAPRLNIQRCEICDGTGRLTDGFCDQCQMGRDLERIESKSVAARLEPDYTVGREGDSETG